MLKWCYESGKRDLREKDALLLCKQLNADYLLTTDDKEARRVAKLLNITSIGTLVFLPSSVEETLMIALKEKITFYDATYLQAAIQNKLKLVTDDLKLHEVACKYVESLQSLDV